MNTNTLSRHYEKLTPEERFKLLLAALGRRDEAEESRLVASANRIGFKMPDYSPFCHAFTELSWYIYADLLDTSGRYLEYFWSADSSCVEPPEALSEGDDDGDEYDSEADPFSEQERREPPEWVKALELAYAAGYILKTKTTGWTLFCDGLSIPPFTMFQIVPGFELFNRALKITEKSSFDSAGIVQWMNTVGRRKEERTLEDIVSPESYRQQCEIGFRERVSFWGG